MRFTRWDQIATLEATNSFCFALADRCLSRISDRNERDVFSGLISARNIDAIVDYVVDYVRLSSADCAAIRQIVALFQKRSDLIYGSTDCRTKEAIISFIASEELCNETNVIFNEVAKGNFSFPRGVESKLFACRRKIASILGDVPDLADLRLRFGPGATTTIPKRISSARRKLSTTYACSEELLPVVKDVLEEVQGWLPQGVDDSCLVPVEIHTGQLVFVPKSLKTHRSVVVEPMLNSFVQCGIGDYMGKRLRLSGVDIRDQFPNQEMARVGSLSGALATLDLSSASDTVACELIHALLPVDWALFLSQFRTGTVTYEGVSIKLEKFSSMGNGFTFPLETLIFYSLALTCVEEKDHLLVRAYGDDIIVPSYAFATLCELLRCVGFIPNAKKSFADGPFRESCGADYHLGINIRPVFLKDGLLGSDVFRLHNFFVRKGDAELASLCLTFLDPDLMIWGPEGYGDGHLVGVWKPMPHKRGHGYSGYTFETFTYLSRKDFTVFGNDRVYPSYSIYLKDSVRRFDLRPVSNRWLLREIALELSGKTEGSRLSYDKKGRFGVSIPGVKGCRRILIYTLNPD